MPFDAHIAQDTLPCCGQADFGISFSIQALTFCIECEQPLINQLIQDAAILFIIFDLEIAFLFPWAIVLDQIGTFGLVAMGIFLSVLVIGFIYEWKKGALEWE